MSGEGNVTTGAPGSPSHHHKHHHLTWHKFWRVARWISPADALADQQIASGEKQRQAEQQAFDDASAESVETPYIDSPRVRSGYKVEEVIAGNTKVEEHKPWWRTLRDKVYGPGIADEFKPHVFLVHPDAAPALAAMMERPDFWHDVECELKGGKGCHPHAEARALTTDLINHPDIGEATIEGPVEIKNLWTKIQRALTKADDKLDHKEDKALGIDK